MFIDWLVIAVYLLGITAIGVYTSKQVSSSASFFISDRKFGKVMMTFFTFGTGTNTDQAVSVAAKTYLSGASGIWYQWLWLFVTPFYWFMVPLFRRMRAVTTADYLNVRFGPSVAVLFALVGILQLSVNIGVVLKAASAMITAISGGSIRPNHRNFRDDGLVRDLRRGRWTECCNRHRFHPGNIDDSLVFSAFAIRVSCGWWDVRIA